MTINPYEPPNAPPEPQPPRVGLPARRVLEMLQVHRGLIRLATVKLALELLPFFGRVNGLEPLWWLTGVVFWPDVAMSIAVGYYAYRAAAGIHGPLAGVFFALASLPPCIGQLLALMLSSDLRDVLRQAGAAVGFFGAKGSQLRTWRTRADAEILTNGE